MDTLRKAVAVILTCLLFTGLAIASVVASVLILILGIAMMFWVKYKAPSRFTTSRATQTNVIDGEYRVIETTQVIEEHKNI